MAGKNTALSKADWTLLKDAVISAEFTDEHVNKIPPRLNDNEVAILLRKYQASRYVGHLNKAAKLLTGGMKNSWLYLEKCG